MSRTSVDRRILLVHPSLQPSGGASGVAAWTLQALASIYRVTVLSWVPVASKPIDTFFGTSLAEVRFDTCLVPAAWRIVAARLPIPAALWRSSLLMRHARRLAGDFDVVIGTHNECDYGRRAIQYVHYPTYLRPRPEVDRRWYHSTAALNGYYRLADAVAGFDPERMRHNVTLANSDWTAARVRLSLGIAPRTVYPPVVAPPDPLPWTGRKRGFLAVGRMTAEKEYPLIMRILARVHRAHPDVTLTIVGTTDRRGRPYRDALHAQAAVLGSWIRILENVPRETVHSLMATHRYGIHGMREEHFGMAPAEMVRAGMIVWVPDGGGQVEIVGDEPRLRYTSEEEAADAIAGVLSSPDEESRLREWLRERATCFSENRFVEETRQVVADFDG